MASPSPSSAPVHRPSACAAPAPRIAATTDDALLLLHNLDGRPLAKAVFDETDPCTAEDLIHLLDAMPMLRRLNCVHSN